MKIKKLGALVVSAALCAGMAAPAFAFEGEAAPVEQPVLPEVVEEDVVTVTDETSGALTPEGNLTLVDDYHTDYSDGSGQQFITLVSKSGNTFYLVIDRNAKGQQTVHFMNLVDEADLLALMEEEDADAYTAEKEAAAQAEQDRQKAEEEAKKAAEEAAASGEEQPKENKVTKIASSFLGVVVLIALAAGGGFYAFTKQKQKKQAEKEALDPDANYLTQERKLSPSLVNFFIAAGDIYEDAAHHNVVFVGRDADGHPRYASSRGIREKFRQDAAGAEKAFGFAHRGTDKQLLVFEAPIDLLSFIELFPKNWQQHNYLSLGGVSGKALRQFLSERPDVERVFLCLDADKAGEDACKRLAALLPDTVSVTRIQPCMKDWNEVLVHRAEIPNRNYFKSIVLKEPSKPETVKIIRMSDVELTPVEWLWKPYLPFGKLSVLQGNPGEGKTYFAMHLAAACTNGKLLPNMERMEPFNVIYQTAEDGLGDTVKPRLIEAGADLDRVLVIDDSEVQLTLSDERIEKAIIENNARLVIIDPIQAYLGADVDMNRANEVRPIFMRLGQVAQRTGCAILLIGHLNKAAGMQSLQRGLGSIDIAAAVRSVMFIGKLKHDPTMRILTHEKSSLAPPGASLAFSLGDEGGFRWVGEYDITADEMLSGIEPQRETKTQQAKDLICTLLAGGKQVLSEDIDKAALERGIPGRTVRDAKRELGDALKSKIVEGRKKVFWME